ncbi:helix-turn-helix domain-containing protein [Capnocytophaga stomatis]|uniref:helix-turn-helix domain-containing protein n=1 Tax=Capnocytophaga stomatis TaxID=1848904 RepID=UPI00385B5680
MNIEKLSQKIKELRKVKCLSQEELATQSGVSLRTVQRVENAESTPSGETLKRILTTLGTSYEALITETITEKPLRTLQGVKEYLHIFSDKLIINRSVIPENITKTYEKSISFLFKTLGVVFIGTLLFSIIAVVFFFLDNTDLAIFATGFATIFLIVTFLIMWFSSGAAPYIERKHIVATKIENTKLGNIHFIITYRDGKRIKERSITFETRDLTYIQEGLLSENLIETNKVSQNYDTLIIMFSIPVLSSLTRFSDKFDFPVVITLWSLTGIVCIIIKVIIKSIRNNRKYAQSL